MMLANINFCSLSLGKEGMHSLSSWGTEIRNAFEKGVGQYTSVPGNVDLSSRRNTVLGVESGSINVSNLESVQEEVSPRQLGRALSTRSLGLRADVPHNVDTARSSIASLSNLPPSAASTVTLFDDFEAGMESGPQAESTPHNSVAQKPVSRHPPPPMPDIRRSSIRYIKTEAESAVYPIEESANENPTSTSAMSSIAHWSTRAVRPLIPKANKLQRSPSDASSHRDSTGGLRQLTLLQDRGNVVNTGSSSPTSTQVRPLTFGKKQKSRNHPAQGAQQDENAVPGAAPAPKNKNLKQLTLARSETSKMRGILRKTEVIPEVVVRPPSTTEHHGFVYDFRA